jgi:hypothetical protein
MNIILTLGTIATSLFLMALWFVILPGYLEIPPLLFPFGFIITEIVTVMVALYINEANKSPYEVD